VVQIDGESLSAEAAQGYRADPSAGWRKKRRERRSLPEVTGLALTLITPGLSLGNTKTPEPLWSAPLM